MSENVGKCQRTVRNVRNVRVVQNRKMLEYGKYQKTSEMLEYGIGRHWKHQKHRSVK